MCSKSGLLYHKKCTDRRGSTANWKKQPWYCQTCLLGSQNHNQTQLVHPTVESLQTITAAHQSPSGVRSDAGNQSLSAVQPHSITPAHNNSPSTSTESSNLFSSRPSQQNSLAVQRDLLSEVQHQGCLALSNETLPSEQDPEYVHVQHQASSSEGQPQLPTEDTLTTEPVQLLSQVQGDVVTTTSAGQSRPPPRFPNTSTRQRGSNVLVNNPELEFHQTALSACRSTITQLEVEQKRLKETLDIRNKRILQLESQIGQAADSIAARDVSSSGTDSITVILKRLDMLENKFNQHAAASPNNIVINTCKADSIPTKLTATSATQTDCCSDIPEYIEIPGDNLTIRDNEDEDNHQPMNL